MPSTFKVVLPESVPTLAQKLNPLWWLMTGGPDATWTAPEINNGTAYLPTVQNQALRNAIWWLRNPAGNFMGFILGFEGQRFTVKGKNVDAVSPRDEDPPRVGTNWTVINGWAPFLSGYHPPFEWYVGWRPNSGGFGVKLVIRKNATSDQVPK